MSKFNKTLLGLDLLKVCKTKLLDFYKMVRYIIYQLTDNILEQKSCPISKCLVNSNKKVPSKAK